MKNYRGLANWVFAGGCVCLVLTALMNFLQGQMLGVTWLGQLVNSSASVTVDIVGIVVIGTVAGRLLAAKKYALSLALWLVVFAAGLWSINSLITFQAGERIAAGDQYAQQLGRTAKADKMNQDNSSWYTRMATKVTGRAARQDMIKASGEEVKAVREAKTEAVIDPGAGAKVLAKFSNQNAETIVIAQITYLSFLLIMLKVVSFPLQGYLRELGTQQQGSPPNHKKNTGGSNGSGGSGGGWRGWFKREPKTVTPEPANSNPPIPIRTPVRATASASPPEPAKVSSGPLRVPVDALNPKPKLSFDEFLDRLSDNVAHGEPATSTRALMRETGWSQTSVVRHQNKLKGRRNKPFKHHGRYAGNGGGYHASAIG